MTPQQFDNIYDMHADAKHYRAQAAQIENDPARINELVIEFLIEDWDLNQSQAEQIARMQ